MTITYKMDGNLYINVTNKCPNACSFCIRNVEGAFENDLWLEKEPAADEIVEEIFSWDLSNYKQLVFCGFGEPLANVDVVLEVCKRVKEKLNIPIRINTNGLANKIHQTDITPKFKSLVDSVSISLNARNAQEYDSICHSEFGLEAFPAILDFARKCKAYVNHVQLTVIDFLPEDIIQECRKIADELGVAFRIRSEVR